MSGLTPEELQEKLETFMPHDSDSHVISIDGSSHDSHQDSELIQAVDNVYIKKFYEYLFPYLELPYTLYWTVYELSTCLLN